MPTGFIRFPAFSPATRGLLASCWKAHYPYQPSTFNAPVSSSPYSSIADTMLRNAVNEFGPTKNDLAKQLFPSSSPAQDGNIQEQFKKAQQHSRSISGFTGYTNTKSSNLLRARSPNIKKPFSKSTSSSAISVPTISVPPSIFSKKSSFEDSNNAIDLTEDLAGTTTALNGSHNAVAFDENDFEDDAELDLDMDYEIPSNMSMKAPSKPTSKKTVPKSPTTYSLPPLQSPSMWQRAMHDPTSSVQTWSSSSPSHMATPPRALLRRKHEDVATPTLVELLSQDSDINPRPTKRRTLPWVQKRAEMDEVSARIEEREEGLAGRSTSSTSAAAAPNKRNKDNTSNFAYTPLPKDKNMPWNTTQSIVKERQKLMKDKQRKAQNDAAAAEAMASHHAQLAVTPITLSDEQKRVLDLVVNQKKSVFFTGSAGTGKSVLMRAIIADLRKQYIREPDRVAVTASTGLAACNVGGVTLHSFGGIGLGKEDIPTLVKKIKRNPKAKGRWLRTKVLIIDEISMVDGDLFDKLEGIARSLRNNGRPFGGIQLVITGDFFQLPPVPDWSSQGKGVKFAFDAATWSTAIHHTIGLTEVFRQKDPVFANMLNEMRLGRISDETVTAFKKLSRPIKFEDSLEATELFPTRNEVENSNSFRMRSLHGKSYRFEARDSGTMQDLEKREKLLANMMAPKSIELKKGAQVMLIKNFDETLVNGTLGKVRAFMSEKTWDLYTENADAFHEVMNDEDVDGDQNGDTLKGQIQSMLSKDRIAGDTGMLFPFVEFKIADGTVRELLVLPEDWKVELPDGEVQAQRSQLPLILAWALSIHKAQGQTLERVKIDLKKIFEKGQAYVALSRATSQAGLEVKNFDKAKVMAHPRVAVFYNSLYSVNKALQYPKVSMLKAKKGKEYDQLTMDNMEQRQAEYGFGDDGNTLAAYG